MTMPALETRRWSADDVRALPDTPGQRFECVDGALLVTPSPTRSHQWMIADLLRMLEAYARAEGVGTALMAPSDVELDAHTLVQPDLYVLPLVDGRRPYDDAEVGVPLLFIEVLSPSTSRFDRVVKRQRYQRQGIEYWIVDLDARLVERWLPTATSPEIISGTITWQPVGAGTMLSLDVAPLFNEAMGVPPDMTRSLLPRRKPTA